MDEIREVWVTTPDLAAYEDDLNVDDGKPVFAAHIRVSTKEQVDEGNSLQDQSERIRRKCTEIYPDGCTIVWFPDEGVSGRLPWKKKGLSKGRYREGLTALTQFIREFKVDYVIVNRCNRLFRRMQYWLDFQEEFLDGYGGICFVSASEGCDTSTKQGKQAISLLMCLAEMEWASSTTQIVDGIRRRASEGYPSNPPFGWRYGDSRLLKKGEHVNFELVPDQAKYVHLAFQLCRSGMSCTKIAAEFTRCGVEMPMGGANWVAGSIHKILRQRKHCGMAKDQDGDWRKGRHYHLRIIEPSEFDEAQRMLKARNAPLKYAPEPMVLAFKGLIDCGICGGTMGHRTTTKHHGRNRSSFACSGHHPGREHTHFYIFADRLVHRVISAISNMAYVGRLEDMASERTRDNAEREHKHLLKREKQLEKDLIRRGRDLARGIIDIDSGPRGKEDHLTVRDNYRKEKARIEGDLASVNKRLEELSRAEEQLEPAVRALRQIVRLLNSMSWENKGKFSSSLIERLTVQPRETHMEVRLKLIFADEIVFKLYRRRASSIRSLGLDGLSPTLLTTAHHLLNGRRIDEICEIRDIDERSISMHVEAIFEAAGTRKWQKVVELLKPHVESRKDEIITWKFKRPPEKPLNENDIHMLDYMLRYHSAERIAELIGSSAQSVYTHFQRIYHRLKVRTMREAVQTAIENGIVTGSLDEFERPDDKELQILRQLNAGKSYRDIAESMGMEHFSILGTLFDWCRRLGGLRHRDLLPLAHERGWLTDEDPPMPDSPSGLELNIIKLVDSGLCSKDIAMRLSTSKVELRRRIRNLCLRLGVPDRRHLPSLARQKGWIDSDKTGTPDPPDPLLIDVLALLDSGVGQKTAWTKKNLSKRSFDSLMRNTFRKYGLSNVADLLSMAREQGWLASGGQVCKPDVRPLQVLRLLDLGLFTEDIAKELSITPNDVINDVGSLCRSLGIRDRKALVLGARERGWIPPERWDPSVKPDERILAMLRSLESGVPYRTVARSVNLTKCSITGIVKRYCSAYGVSGIGELLPLVHKQGWFGQDDALDECSREVLQLLDYGLAVPEIAKDLGMPKREVSRMLGAIRSRVGVPTFDDLLLSAREKGWIPPRESDISQPPDERTLEILGLLDSGVRRSEIGELMGLSVTSLAVIIARQCERYGVSACNELVTLARVRGWIGQGTSEPTERDRRILELRDYGLSSLDISRRLSMKCGEVNSALYLMSQSLGLKSVSDLMPLARERGWVSAERLHISQRPDDMALGIVSMVARGVSRSSIADHLGITTRSLCKVIDRICEKYGVRTVNELVELVAKNGWAQVSADSGIGMGANELAVIKLLDDGFFTYDIAKILQVDYSELMRMFWRTLHSLCMRNQKALLAYARHHNWIPALHRSPACRPSDSALEIIRLLGQGMSSRQVQSHLGLRPRSVAEVTKRLRDACGVSTTDDLVRLALAEWIHD